jgi:hypothetical protein
MPSRSARIGAGSRPQPRSRPKLRLRALVTALVIPLIAVGVPACGQSEATGDPELTIYVSAPMTGPAGAEGRDVATTVRVSRSPMPRARPAASPSPPSTWTSRAATRAAPTRSRRATTLAPRRRTRPRSHTSESSTRRRAGPRFRSPSRRTSFKSHRARARPTSSSRRPSTTRCPRTCRRRRRGHSRESCPPTRSYARASAPKTSSPVPPNRRIFRTRARRCSHGSRTSTGASPAPGRLRV